LRLFRQNLEISAEHGISLIEVLVAIVLIGIMSIGIAANSISAFQIMKKTEMNNAASNLALSKIEELSAIRVNDLNSTYNIVENNIKSGDFKATFKRTTTVVVNSDNSRSITVKVESNSAKLPTAVTFKTTFSMWQ
jgi:prepilin-type N-terminal cleavage/methylation domain-containing protein